MEWIATAPANLALIKYAGKASDKNNWPLNASLSYTLDHLISTVRITEIKASQDKWQFLKDPEKANLIQEPAKSAHELVGPAFISANKPHLNLSDEGVKRFLDFFAFLKKVFQVPMFYLVESANNFPASAGMASSASSFCALTLATHKMALDRSLKLDEVRKWTPSGLSILSRNGSGSSCRSFFRPWALWEGAMAKAIDLPFSKLTHKLIVTDNQKKPVSSSLAHEKIRLSPLFKGRVARAQNRLSELLLALKAQNWKACFEITWAEFQDLHQLYESVGIVYQSDKSRAVLKKLKSFWDQQGDGPLVTMDAGSAVHLLYRPDQKSLTRRISLLFCDK